MGERGTVTGTITLLPNEIIQHIIAQLDRPAVGCLSRVNKLLRELSIPYLFHLIVTRSSPSNFRSLELLAASPLSQHVRSLEYRPACLLGPLVLDRDKPPQGRCQATAQQNGIQPTMARICEEQHAILSGGTDRTALATAVARFPRLDRFVFRYNHDNNTKDDFILGATYQIGAMQENLKSVQHHLNAAFEALRLAKRIRPVRTLELSTHWVPIGDEQHELIREVLRSTHELHFQDGPFFRIVAMWVETPCLRILRISDVSNLDLTLLGQLCRRNAGTLRALYLRDNFYSTPQDKFRNGLSRPPMSVLHAFYEIGQACSLKEVEVCVTTPLGATARKTMIEAILLGRIVAHSSMQAWDVQFPTDPGNKRAVVGGAL